MPLSEESCVACRPGSPRVLDDDLADLLSEIPAWTIVSVKGTPRLERLIQVDSWEAGVRLTNLIAHVATLMDHHPLILLEWGSVTVQWWTHAIKGLHRNDFVMAAKVDELAKSQ